MNDNEILSLYQPAGGWLFMNRESILLLIIKAILHEILKMYRSEFLHRPNTHTPQSLLYRPYHRPILHTQV